MCVWGCFFNNWLTTTTTTATTVAITGAKLVAQVQMKNNNKEEEEVKLYNRMCDIVQKKCNRKGQNVFAVVFWTAQLFAPFLNFSFWGFVFGNKFMFFLQQQWYNNFVAKVYPIFSSPWPYVIVCLIIYSTTFLSLFLPPFALSLSLSLSLYPSPLLTVTIIFPFYFASSPFPLPPSPLLWLSNKKMLSRDEGDDDDDNRSAASQPVSQSASHGHHCGQYYQSGKSQQPDWLKNAAAADW